VVVYFLKGQVDVKRRIESIYVSFFEFAFLTFVFSFFLVLGSDFPHQVWFREQLGLVLLVLGLVGWMLRDRRTDRAEIPLCVWLFFGFVVFELFRQGWGICHVALLKKSAALPASTARFLKAPFQWLFYFSFFLVGFLFFHTRDRARRFLWLCGWIGFFLAVNVIAAVLLRGEPWYVMDQGRVVFFHPGFYFNPAVAKYLLGSFVHTNYVGDIVAIGFFSSLGVLFYCFHAKQPKRTMSAFLVTMEPSFWLSLTFCLVSSLAVFMLMSRGSILFFGVGLVFWAAVYLKRFYSARQLILVLGMVVGLGLFCVSVWNMGRVGGEMKTLGAEFRLSSGQSLTTNVEGAKRALKIFLAHPMLGVGTGGFEDVSQKFASSGSASFPILQFKAMSHYLQLLAEEGVGALIYFVFLAAYFVEVLKRLFRLESQFQFMAGAALTTCVLVVLGHATINHLMQRFSVSVLVYILMGVSLGLLRRDFDHG